MDKTKQNGVLYHAYFEKFHPGGSTLATPPKMSKISKNRHFLGIDPRKKTFFMHKTNQNGFLYHAYTLLMKSSCQNPGGNTLCDSPGGPLWSKIFFGVRNIMILDINTAQNNIFHAKFLPCG